MQPIDVQSTFPKFVQENGEELGQIVEATTCAYLNKLIEFQQEQGGLDRTGAIYTALMAMSWPLQFLSRTIAEPKEGETDTQTASGKELSLVAGLIIGRVFQIREDRVTMDFSCRHILAAIEAASTIAGYDVKPLINQGMIKSYTEGAEKNGKTSLGYWDYLPQAVPSFDEFAEQLRNVSNLSHSKH